MRAQQLYSVAILMSFGLVSFNSVYAQSIERHVFGVAGGDTSSGSTSLSFSIGETMIGTERQTTAALTQGFEQPEQLALGMIEPKILTGAKVYPNPAIDLINLSFNTVSETELTVSTLDALGRQVEAPITIQANGTALRSFDVSNLASGIYFLIITDRNQTRAGEFMFQKI